MDTRPDAQPPVVEWLAQAHPVPSRARNEWWLQGVALIPTGGRFDAVRLSAALVHAAAHSSSPEAVTAFLIDVIGDGAVIHDAYGVGVWYYTLVELGSCGKLAGPDAVRLEPGTWLGVPRLDRTARPGPYWVLPPRPRGSLCSPRAVTELVRLGRQRLAQPSEKPGTPQ